MNIIGLTGGIGCGKTTFTQAFKALNVPVIDADELAHALSQPYESGWQAIVDQWGSRFLTEELTLNRQALREAIFHDPSLKTQLEACLHPLIYRGFEEQTEHYKTSELSYIVWSIPLLFETNRYVHLVHRILVIDVPVVEQLKRVVARGVPYTTAQSIVSSQVSRSVRQAKADDLVINQGSLESVKEIVAALHQVYSRPIKNRMG